MSKLEKITDKVLWQWKIMEYLSYAVVFITPLYFVNNHLIFSFSSPKTIFIIGIVSLMTIFYSWGILIKKKLSFRFTPLHIVLGIFLIVLTLSSILGIDPLNSFFGTWTQSINLILIYTLTVFALLIGFLIKKNKSFLPYILLASFISSVFVVLISYTGGSLVEVFNYGASTIGNNSYTGAYLLFNVCFGIGLFFYFSKIWQKISVVIGTFIILISPIFINKDILLGKIGFAQIIHNPFLLFGYANAATFGLAVSFLIIASFFLIFSSKKATKIIGVILLFSILSGILYTGFRLVNPTSSFHRIYKEEKGENRFIAWSEAQSSFSDHLLLGSGFNNFSYNYQKYFSSDILKLNGPEFYFLQPHNVIWEYASNNGVLGLVSFLVLLFFAFLALFQHKEGEEKRDKIIRITLIGILFGYFIQNLFGFDTPVTYLMLFFLIGLAIGESKKEWVFVIPDKNNDGFKFILSLVIIFNLASMVLFVILPKIEFRKWGTVASTDSMKGRILKRDGIQDISLFGGVSDSSYLAVKFFDLYKANLDKINDSNRSLFLEEIQSIIYQVEKDTERQPYDIRAHLIISKLLNMEISIKGKVEEEMWNQSYNNIKEAIKINNQDPNTYIILAQTYILKEDFKNARLSVRQAIVIAPTYMKSYEYARKILKIKPDNNFKEYVDNMEKMWFITTP